MSPEDFEYRFVCGVCDAIAAYTRDMESRMPSAFCYRGANLRFAVERALFVEIANDEALFDLFVRREQNALPPSVRVDGHPRAAIARHLLSGKATTVESGPADIPSPLRGAYRHAHSALSALPVRFSVRRDQSHVDVLVCIHQPKFVAFLEPVTRRLRQSYAFAGFSGSPKILDFLAEQKLPRVPSAPAARIDWTLPAGLADMPWITGRFNEAVDLLRRVRPRCVVLVEGNAPTDDIMSRAAECVGVPSICFQQGWSPIVHSGFRNMRYTRMLAWGDGFVDLLQAMNPQQRFVSTGNFTVSCPPGAETRRAVTFFLQGPTRLLSDQRHAQLVDLAVETARRSPEVLIIVRDHPEHPLSPSTRAVFAAMPNVRVLSPGVATVGEILAQTRIAVSVYSSAILDSVASGVLPVVVNLTSMPAYFPDVGAEGCGIEVDNREDAVSAISRCLTDTTYADSFAPRIDRFRRRFFAATGSDAAALAIQEIEKITAA
jgi:hypothetical protein